MMHRQEATPMVTRVIEFSPTSDAAAEFVQVIEETALRIVKAQAECIVAFVRVRGQVVMGVSVWKSLSDAERYSRECYPDIEKMLRPFLKCDPKLYTFESRQIEFLNMRARAMVPKTSTRTRKLSSPNESTRTRLDQQSA
jgi:hypothetical protein